MTSGTEVNINGKTFKNVISRGRLAAAEGYTKYSDTYVCGLNAINICLKMWGYSKQLTQSEYAYDTICGHRIGKSYRGFYEENIAPYFTFYSWKGEQRSFQHLSVNWSFIDDTDYSLYSMIVMGGLDFCAHYTIVIGVDTTKRHYLVIDQKLKVWLVDMELMEKITVYKASKSVGLYSQHSLYRVG